MSPCCVGSVAACHDHPVRRGALLTTRLCVAVTMRLKCLHSVHVSVCLVKCLSQTHPWAPVVAGGSPRHPELFSTVMRDVWPVCSETLIGALCSRASRDFEGLREASQEVTPIMIILRGAPETYCCQDIHVGSVALYMQAFIAALLPVLYN